MIVNMYGWCMYAKLIGYTVKKHRWLLWYIPLCAYAIIESKSKRVPYTQSVTSIYIYIYTSTYDKWASVLSSSYFISYTVYTWQYSHIYLHVHFIPFFFSFFFFIWCSRSALHIMCMYHTWMLEFVRQLEYRIQNAHTFKRNRTNERSEAFAERTQARTRFGLCMSMQEFIFVFFFFYFHHFEWNTEINTYSTYRSGTSNNNDSYNNNNNKIKKKKSARIAEPAKHYERVKKSSGNLCMLWLTVGNHSL